MVTKPIGAALKSFLDFAINGGSITCVPFDVIRRSLPHPFTKVLTEGF